MNDEKGKKVEKIQLQSLPETKPFFSDGAFISTILHEYGKTKERDAHIQLAFSHGNSIVSMITVSSAHANAIIDILKQKIEEAENFKKTGKRPQQKIEKSTEEANYIG